MGCTPSYNIRYLEFPRVVLGYRVSVWGGDINAESCTRWKPNKLEWCNFFTMLGVTTEFCRGDTPMSPGCTRVTSMSPAGCTPDRSSDERCAGGIGGGAATNAGGDDDDACMMVVMMMMVVVVVVAVVVMTVVFIKIKTNPDRMHEK